MPDDGTTPIATIPKNSREEMRVRLTEFHGKPYADVRIFVDGRDPDGRVPTGKGVVVAPDRIADLIIGLGEARAELIRRGVIQADA